MSNTKATVLICSSLILGIVIGGGLVGYLSVQWVKFTSTTMEATASYGAAQSVMLLNQLRRGDAKFPVEMLEVQLDNDLISLWAFYKDAPADKRNDHLLKLLAKIRDYRAKYPRKTENPEIDQTVAEVLAWAR